MSEKIRIEIDVEYAYGGFAGWQAHVDGEVFAIPNAVVEAAIPPDELPLPVRWKRRLDVVAGRLHNETIGHRKKDAWSKRLHAIAKSMQSRYVMKGRVNERKASAFSERLTIECDRLRNRSHRAKRSQWDIWAEGCSRNMRHRHTYRTADG